MTTSLAEELDALPEPVRARLQAHGFDRAQLIEFARRLRDPSLFDNRVSGSVDVPPPEDIVDAPEPAAPGAADIERQGRQLISEGKCALVVLAGGMATRMGSVVKALVEALPGRTFLDLRLAERRHLERGASGIVPLWLMTSAATDAAIRTALGDKIDGRSVALFPQFLSLRLTPDGVLFRNEEGSPSDYAPGHGDLPDALKKSGLLDDFVRRGGKYVTVANLDNLGATLDPTIIGLHAARGRPVTCEVVDKLETDRGGIPVRHGGKTVVLEEFRIPETFDPSRVRVFNTNTFHFDATALKDLGIDWTYFVVKKNVQGKSAIQFERLINQVTQHLDTTYLRVPRSGVRSRFLPVKDPEELVQRRPEIEAVARARGMLE
jgi:UTP--glucose-1-phosphate uridylyltransferase